MNWEERIEARPGIMLGKPVIRSTRITVELILERIQAGETVEQITNSFKNIDIRDVQAAADFDKSFTVIGKNKIKIKKIA